MTLLLLAPLLGFIIAGSVVLRQEAWEQGPFRND
jgi:hypothetical protein